jgi:hypothetical protein
MTRETGIVTFGLWNKEGDGKLVQRFENILKFALFVQERL